MSRATTSEDKIQLHKHGRRWKDLICIWLSFARPIRWEVGDKSTGAGGGVAPAIPGNILDIRTAWVSSNSAGEARGRPSTCSKCPRRRLRKTGSSVKARELRETAYSRRGRGNALCYPELVGKFRADIIETMLTLEQTWSLLFCLLQLFGY